MNNPIVITGIGMELPGIGNAISLIDQLSIREPASDFIPSAELGKKGLIGKDRATLMAMCATSRCLKDCGEIDRDRVGVIVACNFGNIDLVCASAETIQQGRLRELSPLELPNASSNIVASSIAIRFKLKSLNIAMCGGSNSGHQAVALAAQSIRSRRAERVLVVGVEPKSVIRQRLCQADKDRSSTNNAEQPAKVCQTTEPLPMEGATALLLESESAARARGQRIYCRVSKSSLLEFRSLRESVRSSVSLALPGLWLTPNGTSSEVANAIQDCLTNELPKTKPHDIFREFGEGHCLSGVLQCVIACQWLQHHQGSVLATSGGHDAPFSSTLFDHFD